MAPGRCARVTGPGSEALVGVMPAAEADRVSACWPARSGVGRALRGPRPGAARPTARVTLTTPERTMRDAGARRSITWSSRPGPRPPAAPRPTGSSFARRGVRDRFADGGSSTRRRGGHEAGPCRPRAGDGGGTVRMAPRAQPAARRADIRAHRRAAHRRVRPRPSLHDRRFSLLPLLHVLDMRPTAPRARRPPRDVRLDGPTCTGACTGTSGTRRARATPAPTATARSWRRSSWTRRSSRRRRELFRRSRDVLSLAVHGVEHRRRSCCASPTTAGARALLAGALAQMKAFRGRNRRTARPRPRSAARRLLRVRRASLAELGLDLSVRRRRRRRARPGLGGRNRDSSQAGCAPAARRLATGGGARTQPPCADRLILYGTVGTWPAGWTSGREAAPARAGDVTWGSLSAIAESNALTGLEGGLLACTRSARSGSPAARCRRSPSSRSRWPGLRADRIVIAARDVNGARSALRRAAPVTAGTTVELWLERAPPAAPVAARTAGT